MSRLTAGGRLERLLSIVPWVVANDGPTLREVAERFDYPEASLLSDLTEVLFMVGVYPYTPDQLVEVVVEDDRVWVHYAEYFERPLRLTPAQALALVTAASSLLAVPGADLEGPLARGIAKLAASLGVAPGNDLEVDLGAASADTMASVRAAIEAHRRLRIEYYAYGRDEAATEREIEPYRLTSDQGAWYLLAYCHRANGERLFRLDRMRSVVDTAIAFDPPTSIPDVSVFEASASDPRVTLRLSAAAAWVPDSHPVESVEHLDDGSLRIRLAISALPWLERLLVRLGDDAVLEAADDGIPLDTAARTAGRILALWRIGRLTCAEVPSDDLTSPEDPDWVDAIVRRAMERAAADPDAASVPISADVPSHTVSAANDLHTAPGPAGSVTGPRTFEPEPIAVRDPDAATVVALTDGATNARFGNSEAPRLPRAEDFVSSHDPTDPASRAVIAGAAAATDDPFHDDHFDDDLDLDDLDTPTTVSSRMRSFLEWGAVIIGALAVALLIKTFLVQAYVIPSESMVPTLEIGDRVLVNKLSYSVGDITRGDLIVFHRPPSQAEGEDDLIKRVVALGGETIEIRDGQVFILERGATEVRLLQEPYLEEGVVTDGLQNPPGCVEESTDGTTCTVPEGHLFMMGDNRGGSSDSRFFGPISEDLVVGRAFLRVWPLGRLGFL